MELAEFQDKDEGRIQQEGLEFAELDSYDIFGLSAMIYRCVPHHRVRYIIGATGEGRRRLLRAPNQLLFFIEYIFI